MEVKHPKTTKIFKFENVNKPGIEAGRIGLRLMPNRLSHFKNFKVYKLNSRAKAAEASAPDKILSFGVNGKRNMLYDARQRPQSVLLHGRVYIVYNADATPTKNKKGKAYRMLITYDPKTRKFTEPVRIGPQSSDHHDSPIIWADESDYLHVLYGCHRSPGTHLISAKPIIAGTPKVKWKEAPQIARKLSYPTVYRIYTIKRK